MRGNQESILFFNPLIWFYKSVHLFVGPHQGLLPTNEESCRLVFRRCGEQKTRGNTKVVAQTLGAE